jgi:hypothetical protein
MSRVALKTLGASDVSNVIVCRQPLHGGFVENNGFVFPTGFALSPCQLASTGVNYGPMA